jgi:hypothetical protein
MAAWKPFAGGTLFIASGPAGDHLFVIAFEPGNIQGRGQSEQILLVPFCTVYPGGKHDSACVIQAGEHEFITHESFMDYRNARIESVSHVRDRIADGTFREHHPVTEPLLRRIQQGLASSKRVPRYVIDDFCPE